MRQPHICAGAIVLAAASGLAGCASWSNPTVPAADVAPAQYLGMTCQQLKNEKRRIATRQTDLAPSLVPVEDEQKREQELAQLSGAVKTIDKVSVDKKCG
jgi:hypothetical protein